MLEKEKKRNNRRERDNEGECVSTGVRLFDVCVHVCVHGACAYSRKYQGDAGKMELIEEADDVWG